MKLLICTQVVDKNHSNLGSFHRWLEEFAKHCESITVICLFKGEHTLPANVRVFSLGKENGAPRLRRIWRFVRYVVRERAEYDGVFVHMNPEYVILGGALWRLMGKQIALWYTHKSVNLRLRIAVFFVNSVCTASAKSFRLKTRKLHVLGHGIDTDMFSLRTTVHPEGVLRITTAGRISETKRLMEMLDALGILAKRSQLFFFTVIGAPITESDIAYEKRFREEAARRPYSACVRFAGAVRFEDMPVYLGETDVFINLSNTGSIDRAVLEALSCGVPVVTSNEAFAEELPAGMFVRDTAPETLADAILGTKTANREALRAYVIAKHSLSSLVPNILDTIRI